MATFACFDVETTSLDPTNGRVIEVAVVRIERDGAPAGEWTTLVDGETGNLGRTDIHGIRQAWLKDAPRFADIAGDLTHELAGCVPVAHNSSFDVGFLHAEWRRARLGSLHLKAVDTVPMARSLGLPGQLGKLADDLGTPLVDAHQALDDARALAAVLVVMLDRGGKPHDVPPFELRRSYPKPSGLVRHRPSPGTPIHWSTEPLPGQQRLDL